MEVLHPHCAGLDVHKESVVACVRHMVDGKVAPQVKTFKTTTQDLMALSDWLSAEGCTHIAMEATGVYWKPVWHILSDGEFELILANAAHVKNVPGRKTDVNDSAWLADLMAHGLVRPSFVPDEPTQQMRDLLRTRKQMVRERSSHIQRIQKTLEDANIKIGFGGNQHTGPQRAAHYRSLDRRPDRAPGLGGAGHFDNRAKDKQVKRLVSRLENLGFEVKITPLAA
jgi:transposase